MVDARVRFGDGSGVARVDCDMHFFEEPDTWSSYADPGARDRALRLEPDELGYWWLVHEGRRLRLTEPHRPGDVDAMGAYRQRRREGLPPLQDYTEACADFSDAKARLAHLDRTGFDEAVLFPNYGLLWERELTADPPALQTNMTAWNRYAADVRSEGGGRLHPVGHLSLRDLAWLEQELATLSAAGIRLGFIAPASVDGRPLSAPELDRAWAAFVDNGITPVFHVADQPRVFGDEWFGLDQPDATVSVLQSVFLWTPVALAVSDLILGGVLDRHPDLRLGIMELSAPWVPLHLMMLDGGLDFASRFEGSPHGLPLRPSEYFRRQVRVAAFSYERPDKLTRAAGDIFMACSDYPHAEGTTTPLQDYAASGDLSPEAAPALFGGNIEYLLRRETAA